MSWQLRMQLQRLCILAVPHTGRPSMRQAQAQASRHVATQAHTVRHAVQLPLLFITIMATFVHMLLQTPTVCLLCVCVRH
jgi:hypothetical protein